MFVDLTGKETSEGQTPRNGYTQYIHDNILNTESMKGYIISLILEKYAKKLIHCEALNKHNR